MAVAPASAADAANSMTEKATHKPARASSVRRSAFAVSKANDANRSTRWASARSRRQWWRVDLGAQRSVSRVSIDWASAYAARYRIQTSGDGRTWHTAASVRAHHSATRATSFAARSARYVRMYGVKPATRWGFSIQEMKVFGPRDASTPAPAAPAPKAPGTSSGAPAASGNPTPTGARVFDGTRKANWSQIIEAAPDRISDTGDPLGAAGNVLKFTVQDGDTVISPNPRAQLETSDFINPGDEIWFGGRIFVPADFQTPPSGSWITLSSVYGPPYSGASPAPIQIVQGATDSEPTFGIVSKDWTTRYWGVPLSQMRGKWVSWLIHEKFATDGWMEAWVNGKQVMARRNLALIDGSNNGGANHITQTFYREKGMWSTATIYHADFGVWKVGG
jgi:hypothetical protein